MYDWRTVWIGGAGKGQGVAENDPSLMRGLALFGWLAISAAAATAKSTSVSAAKLSAAATVFGEDG